MLFLVAISHHPVARAPASAELLASITQLAPMDRLVHGVLIALLAAMTYGLIALSIRLGLARTSVLAALVVFALGVVVTVGAGIVDGFMVPALAAHFAGKSPDEVRIGIDLLVTAGIAIQACTKVGLVLMCAGIFLWSVALASIAQLATRLIGALGFVAAIASIVALAMLGTIGVHALLGVAALQAAWYLAIGVWLATDR